MAQEPYANNPPPGPGGPEVPPALTSGQTTPEQRRRAFLILFLSLICLGLGQNLIFVILPQVSREIGLSEQPVLMIFSVSAVFWVLLNPFWGRQSDIYGRKPIIMVGLIGFSVSMILFASVLWIGMAGWLTLLFLYPLMVVTRCIYGIFGPGAMTAGQAYVADRTTRKERTGAIATLTAAFGLGITLGPGLAGALQAFGTLTPLYVVAVIGLISTAAIWFYLPERTKPVARREDIVRVRLRDERVLPFLIFSVVVGTALAVPIQTIAFFIMDRMGVAPGEAGGLIGVALMTASLATLIGQLVIVQRFNLQPPTLIWAGTLLCLLGFLSMILTRNFEVIVFGMVLFGLGSGLLRPGYTAAASLAVTPDEQASVAGLTNASGAAGFIFAPIVGGALYEHDPLAPYIMSIVFLAGLLVYFALERRLRAAPRPDQEGDDLPRFS